eukprot:scaffold8251_cov535-Pinguiococcus_pyrenoidosus.AAC.1
MASGPSERQPRSRARLRTTTRQAAPIRAVPTACSTRTFCWSMMRLGVRHTTCPIGTATAATTRAMSPKPNRNCLARS